MRESHNSMDRKRATSRTAVVAGSVWETRMMNDEIMGGFKVFNATGVKNPEDENREKKQRIPKQSPVAKRKTWKSDDSIQIGGSVAKKIPNSKFNEVTERSPVQIRKLKPKSTDLDDGEEVEKSPIHKMKVRSDEGKEVSERNPVHIRKLNLKTIQISGGIEKNSAQLREIKTESVNDTDESKMDSNPLPEKVLDELRKTSIGSKIEKTELKQSVDESIDEIEKNPVEIEEIGSDLGEENPISSGLVDAGPVTSVSQPNYNAVALVCNEEDSEEKIVVEEEEHSIEEMKSEEQKPKKTVNNEKKLNRIKEKPSPISSPIVKKQSTNLVNYSRINPSPAKAKAKAIPEFDRFQSQSNPQRVPQNHGKLQSLIDLAMWRDASRSAFIFGIGTFIIISSSYTKDLNFSLISVFSYLGLVYLAAIFIFRSIISREIVDETSEEYVFGEEEAVWLLKMVLPYLNEFLIKIKALFSGDPATTMKLAVLLFVLARCGSSITIWKMAKLGFFGMFTVPKICSSYSTQLTSYGKFWVRRFHDAWESCTHKKAVGFGIFTLVWNLSSVVARIWAVFMLFAAFRYYQQSMATNDDCAVEEELKCEPLWQGHAGGRRLRRGLTAPTNMGTSTKEKKKVLI